MGAGAPTKERKMEKLTGQEAIEYKKINPNAELNKFNDPTEEERFDISIDDAEDIIREDPGLIYVEIETEYHGDPRIVFDNGGGITLQLPGFCHHYDNAEQCAEDIKSWLEVASEDEVEDWEGNEEDAVFEPTYDQIRNGGYRVWMVEDFVGASIERITNESWGNIQDLYAELACKMLK